MKKFSLSHVILYSKGWYAKTDNIVEDLKSILSLDGYTPFNKNDVAYLLVRALQRSEIQESDLIQVLEGISPNQCWKFGFYTKDHKWVDGYESLPDYDIELATIHYVLSVIRFMEMNSETWDKVTPNYEVYPEKMGIDREFHKYCFGEYPKHTSKWIVDIINSLPYFN